MVARGDGRSRSRRSVIWSLPDPKLPLNEEALAGLGRHELLGLVLAQAEVIQSLQAELARLRLKVAELEAQAGRTRGTRRCHRLGIRPRSGNARPRNGPVAKPGRAASRSGSGASSAAPEVIMRGCRPIPM
jgi:hypothetical protein